MPSRIAWTNKAQALRGLQALQPHSKAAIGSNSWRRSAGERAGFLKDDQSKPFRKVRGELSLTFANWQAQYSSVQAANIEYL